MVSIFGMLSFLVSELILVQNILSRKEISFISKIDALYGLVSIIAVGAGFTLWFGVGKPASFYENPVFYTKLFLAIVVGLISIWPTVYFIKNRKGEKDDIITVDNKIKKLIVLQLILLGIIPLFATMMANGIRF